MTPAVSVVVPLYNKARTIEATLRSICRQTCGEFELLVVDDGSTDGSAEIARAFPDPRVSVISQPNGGPGSARNAGIRAARADVVAFLDADDEWLPGYLASVTGVLAARPDVAAVTTAWYDMPGRVSTVDMWKARGIRAGDFVVGPGTTGGQLVAIAAFMWPCTTAIRRSIALESGGFYARNGCRYAEDVHLWLKVLFNHKVHFLLEPLAFFNRQESELSGNYRGMRPIEPFLTDPGDVYAATPAPLAPVLRRFLALRAMKTSCVLSYWGQWREAVGMWRAHLSWHALRHSITWLAIGMGNPVTRVLAGWWRGMRS